MYHEPLRPNTETQTKTKAGSYEIKIVFQEKNKKKQKNKFFQIEVLTTQWMESRFVSSV
jgi:hypothetical protein